MTCGGPMYIHLVLCTDVKILGSTRSIKSEYLHVHDLS